MTRLFRKYKRIAKSISPLEISTNFSHENLSWDDLFLTGTPSNTTDLFLGKYSEDGIKFIIERFGLDRQARHLGIRQLYVKIDTRDPYRHILIIYSGDAPDRDHIVMEFVARYQHLIPKDVDAEFLYTNPLKVLTVEWLLLQNPQASFTRHKPRLPGQEHPGLGLGDELLALFTLMGRHLQVDGIINVPEYLHTGLLFGKRFIFLSPHVQVQVAQIAHDLWKKYRLSVIAWASTLGAIVRIDTGKAFQWQPRKQIIPIHSQLRQYFKSDVYQSIASSVSSRVMYTIDEELLRKALAAMDEPPFEL